ncbi:hypothetical protein [Streptomyces sp. NPDC059468]|uniref:hypothetical protein n=1 Tax=Streptomyces sp. NPDC059468 TaxID=3346845 RepID=UPI003677B9A1
MVEEELELEQGALVYDMVRDVVARVMEVGDSRVSLRNPNGGVEWEREKSPRYLRPPTQSELLSARVAKVNQDSSYNSGSWGA